MSKQKSPPAPHSVEQILQFAAQLPLGEIEELSFALSALVEAVDGEHPDNQASKPRSGARGGSRIEWKIINGYGPYPYLRFRRDGKHRSYYLKELAVDRRTSNSALLN